MNNPLVSIIVPCYNQAQYLPETLDSVLVQTYSNWECIIVNDGSPDNTEEIAKLYCDKDSRFKYVYKKNGGLSSARNSGIRSSKGEYILPLDSDDIIGQEYLTSAIKRFIQYPKTKLVYCEAEFFGEINELWNLPTYEYEILLFGNLIFCSAIFKRVDFDKTNGYNEDMRQGLEDWDFWLSLLVEKDIVYRIPKVYFFYRIKRISLSTLLTVEKQELVTKIIYENHKQLYEKYLPNIIWKTSQVEQQQFLINDLEKELKNIRSSKAYRYGKFLLKPIKTLKSILNKNQSK